MDPTNAAAWGCFDIVTGAFDTAALALRRIEPHWLPTLRPCGAIAGAVSPAAAQWLGIPAGVPVTVAIGDNQVSIVT